MKMKSALALLTALCIMTSTAAPTLAAVESLSNSSEQVEPQNESIVTPSTDAEINDETASDELESFEYGNETFEQQVLSPEFSNTETLEDVVVQEEQLQTAIQEEQPQTVAQEAAAPTISGFTLYNEASINTNKQYMIVAQKRMVLKYMRCISVKKEKQ